jgi:uroporphyrinogen-III synthase
VTFRVAVTRPEPQATDTATRLSAAGYAVVKAPLMTPVPRDGPGSPHGVGTLVLTSRTAAMLMAAHPSFHHLPVHAVGAATAAEARHAGFSRVTSADGDVEALLPRLDDAREPIVHLCGADHRGALVDRLVASGRAAERRILYAMEPTGPLPPAPGPIHAVLLYSPRSAALYAERARSPLWREATCLALSAAVAEPLGAMPRVEVAERPDEGALFLALHRLARERAEQAVAPPGR